MHSGIEIERTCFQIENLKTYKRRRSLRLAEPTLSREDGLQGDTLSLQIIESPVSWISLNDTVDLRAAPLNELLPIAQGTVLIDSVQQLWTEAVQSSIPPHGKYYIYDHLQNTRVVYHIVCAPPNTSPPFRRELDQVLDYYSYGKILRQFTAPDKGVKYKSTAHSLSRVNGKRDNETDFDYRIARYYSLSRNSGNSEIGRFLSVDPRADKYPGWSPFNYVLGNPISNIDPWGDTVKVYTETIDATKNLARHAFIEVKTDNNHVLIELFGPNENPAQDGKGLPRFELVTDKSQIWGRNNVKEHDVTRPKDSPEGNMDFENKILEIADFFNNCETTCKNGKEVPNYTNVPQYNATGPNSNGFVNFIINQSGGEVKLPWNAAFKDDKAYFEKYYPSGSTYKFTVTDETLK